MEKGRIREKEGKKKRDVGKLRKGEGIGEIK